MKKKQAKNWTRNVIYILIFQVFHRTDVEIEVSNDSFLLYAVFFCFSLGTIVREIFVVLLTIQYLIWLWLCPWQPGTYLILEWQKKNNCWNIYLFALPWWSGLRSACLAIRRISKGISREQIRQTVLHGLYEYVLSPGFLTVRFFLSVRWTAPNRTVGFLPSSKPNSTAP